jgi:hypothetical protein
MKHLLLIAILLMTTNCMAIPAAVVVYKGSQAANLATNGTDGKTLTANDSAACKAGDEAACNRCLAYSAVLGAFHCTMFDEIDKHLPVITTIRPQGYGGSKYWAMMKEGK